MKQNRHVKTDALDETAVPQLLRPDPVAVCTCLRHSTDAPRIGLDSQMRQFRYEIESIFQNGCDIRDRRAAIDE